MKDLTTGSLTRHLLSMGAFIGIGLIFQAAYFLIDLYFVSALGADTIAGVSAAGNTSFLIMAASQLVGVGVVSLIANAAGRKDPSEAVLIFNQSIVMASLACVATLVLGVALTPSLVGGLAASPGSAAAGRAYLYAFLPSLASMFPATALMSSLRGAGIVRPAMIMQTSSLALNAALAPVLIAGWGTGHALGAAGAGLASSIAAICGAAGLVVAWPRIGSGLTVQRALLAPRLRLWLRIIGIGLPVAGEFAMIFLITTIVYWVIRHFGAPAQAGFGIGSRIMTSIFLPAMAVAFAVAPVAGQNMGAGLAERVRGTALRAGGISTVLMLGLSILCHSRPDLLIAVFTADPAVTKVAATYLSVLSWNFVAIGLVFVCSGMFQALGNTVPSFLSSASRLFTYALPAIFMAGHPGISLTDYWYLSVASTSLQAVLSLLLLRRTLARRLRPAPPAGASKAEPLPA